VEVVPQGTFIERIRAGGAGIGGFYTPTGVGTVVAEGKEERVIGGVRYLLEYPLRADFAFIKAYKADTWGNLIYRMSTRNFNPVMATAARVTVVDVEEIVEAGEFDQESVVTPGIFVHRLVKGPKHDLHGFE
jgi:3-oxoacid CoA-transferase subunit A